MHVNLAILSRSGVTTRAGAAPPPPAPTIVSIANVIGEAYGDPAGGYSVTLIGTGFLAGLTDVEIDGVACGGLVIVDDTEATVTVPASAVIDVAVDVEVSGPGGSDTLVGGWLYWNPAAYGDTSCWIRGDDVTHVAGAVSRMNDKTVNGRDFILGTGSPTLVVGGLNGHDVVQFDNADDGLESTGFPASEFFTDDEGASYGVQRFTTYDTNAANSWVNQCAWGDLELFVGEFAKSAGPAVLSYSWDGSDDAASDTAPAAGEWMLTTRRHTGGNLGMRVGFGDYSTMVEVASGPSTGGLDTPLNLGKSASLQPMNGELADRFWTPVPLDATTDAKARSYFATRYFS